MKNVLRVGIAGAVLALLSLSRLVGGKGSVRRMRVVRGGDDGNCGSCC